jgi:hypothetical protein
MVATETKPLIQEEIWHEGITLADSGWLRALGCVIPEGDYETQWFTFMNCAIDAGSRTLNGRGDETGTVAARRGFFDLIPATAPALEAIRSSAPKLVKPTTFVQTQRYLHQEGADVRKVIKRFPEVIGLAVDTMASKFAMLRNLEIKPERVANLAPAALGQANETIIDKCQNLANLGLEASRIVNVYPNVIASATDTICKKMANFDALGIDARKLITNGPSLLSSNPETVKSKIMLVRSIARVMYGSEGGYEQRANNMVEDFPVMIGSKREKIQTIGRIGLRLFDAADLDEVRINTIGSLFITNVEGLLVAYLQDGESVTTLNNLISRAASYRKSSKQELARIIRAHSDDPIVQGYYKGYPAAA